MFASMFTIPARNPDYHVKMECCYDGPQPLTAVAFRTHTHTLGRLVWMDRIALGAGLPATDEAPALRRSPLLPQAFAMVSDQAGAKNPGGGEDGGGDSYINEALPGPLVIRAGQRLRATCRFNASTSDHDVPAGATSANEMCNLYLLFHADVPTALGCYDFSGAPVHTESGPLAPAPDGDDKLAPLPHGWAPPATLGQAGGADLSPDGSRLWLFHRGARVWDADAFDAKHVMAASAEAVGADAVVALDVGTGAIVSSFGAGTFLMPHGLSTDAWGNVWLTDVGLHQVFKYSAQGQRLLAVGAARSPGTGADGFCQPAAVVAASDGSFFVADGYCGSRVVAFHANGTYRGAWSPPAGATALRVPHALALDDCAGLLHVADRENGRVLTLAGVAGPPESWTVLGEWSTAALGLPYALARAAGGDVFALTWQRDAAGAAAPKGATHLVRLGDGRATRPAAAEPAAAWDVPGSDAPHALALAAGPGGGPGQVVFMGETRTAGPVLHRLSLGDVDICPWAGCGAAMTHLRAPGVGPGYVTPAAQRRRVLLTRFALVGAVALLIAAAAMPGGRARAMLPGSSGRNKARHSAVQADTPPTPKGPKKAKGALPSLGAVEEGTAEPPRAPGP
jgi:hypothetical protein